MHHLSGLVNVLINFKETITDGFFELKMLVLLLFFTFSDLITVILRIEELVFSGCTVLYTPGLCDQEACFSRGEYAERR